MAAGREGRAHPESDWDIAEEELQAWNAAIGLRNRIVHEYMNIDIERVLELVRTDQHKFVTEFLLAPVNDH